MEKIKVYMRFPWKISDSQYYKSLIENPPRDIEYISGNENSGIITNKTKLGNINFLKSFIRRLLEFIKIPIINVHETPTHKDYDIIHCAHCLSKNSGPWVADFESLWQMWISGRNTNKGIKKVKKVIMDKDCKAIIAWTDAAKKEIIEKYPEIKNKVHVVGFGQEKQRIGGKLGKRIRLVFIGRYFFWKGGLHALEAMDKLTKKYSNVDAIIVSQIPVKILEKYKENDRIKFLGLIPHNKILDEILPSSDILIYPGYSDTFGFIFAEAMSFGIPVITVDGFARKELVKNGKTGYVIPNKKELSDAELEILNPEIIKKIVDKTSKLIKDETLRKKMSKNCLDEVDLGIFSIKKRNEKLRKIYLDSKA